MGWFILAHINVGIPVVCKNCSNTPKAVFCKIAMKRLAARWQGPSRDDDSEGYFQMWNFIGDGWTLNNKHDELEPIRSSLICSTNIGADVVYFYYFHADHPMAHKSSVSSFHKKPAHFSTLADRTTRRSHFFLLHVCLSRPSLKKNQDKNWLDCLRTIIKYFFECWWNVCVHVLVGFVNT